MLMPTIKMKEQTMRARTLRCVENLPARKRVTLIMLFCVIIGGAIVTGSPLA